MLLKPPPSGDQTDDRCISLFGNPYLRLITVCFPCIWFTINLVYYGLILNMNTFGGNVYLNTVSFFLHNKFNFAWTRHSKLGWKKNWWRDFVEINFANRSLSRSLSVDMHFIIVLVFVAVLQNVFFQNDIYSHFLFGSVDVFRCHMARCQESCTNRKIFCSLVFLSVNCLFAFFTVYIKTWPELTSQ